MKKLIVAYQGETGAFSELASKKYFGDNIQPSPSLTFEIVFEKVKSGSANYGIVPVENSLYGSVFETFDLLLKYPLKIVGEINLQINHYLMGVIKYKLNEIKHIYSHPQALGQCSDLLQTLKGAQIHPVYDTAGAAKNNLSQKEYSAAIASKLAAKEYGLKIIKEKIQNTKENYTRFLIISKKSSTPDSPGNKTKTSLCFELKSVPGSLFKALSVFALRDINLTKIESRPIPHLSFQYIFYVDLIGNLKETRIKNALNHLEEISKTVVVFGSYEIGKTVKE